MEPLSLLGVLVILIGVLGVVLPVLPGTPLIWLGALLFDWGYEWQVLGWVWLGVLFLLMLLSEVGDWMLSNIGAQRGGASKRALVVGAVLGLIGLLLLPPFGLIIGSIAGVVGTEILLSRDTRRALKAGGGWLVGWVLSLLFRGLIAMAMVGIIWWQA